MNCIKCGKEIGLIDLEFQDGECLICYMKKELSKGELTKTPLQGWQCPRCGKCWSPFYYGACDCFVPHTITQSSVEKVFDPQGLLDDKHGNVCYETGMMDNH